MHALLIGLISGYFFAACAPVLWSNVRLFSVGCAFLLLLAGLHAARRGVRSGGTPVCLSSAMSGAVVALLATLTGATFSIGVLGGHLHGWQSHAQAGSGCVPAAQPELVRLEVLGLPSRTTDGSRFDAKVVSIRSGCAALLGQRLRVSWKNAAWPAAGQRIVAQVRLRPIRGSVSPGAFDHELHLARRGIRMGAYVTRTLAVSEPAGLGAGTMSRVRLAVRRALEAMPLQHRGVLLALLTGDSALMPRASWELLQTTGTVHLLVISGLHVGLVAVGVLFGVRTVIGLLGLLWRAVPAGRGWRLPRGRISRRMVEALAASVLLSGYVFFTGSGVAALRALLMVVVVIFAWSAGRQIAAAPLLMVAGVAVVGTQLGAGLGAGFWLSFGLVGWLLVKSASVVDRQDTDVAGGVTSRWARGWQLGRTLLGLHLGCSLVLVPMLAWLGLPIALVSPVANLLAVPVVTLLLVPLVLCAGVLLLFSASLSARLFGVADAVADGVLLGLEWLGGSLPLVSPPEFTGLGYAAFGVLLLAMLLPVTGLVRAAAGVVLMHVGWTAWATDETANPASTSRWATLTRVYAAPIARGQFIVQLLDVGQGLAVLVQTTNQTLLYDTGAKFPSGFNFVEAVIAPALHAKRVEALDVLIISHHDLDHAGGLTEVKKLFKPVRSVGSVRDAGCMEAGRQARWQADGVQFEVMQHRNGATSNDRSCVLVVRGLATTAVISGDIEAAAERVLLPRLPRAVDVLVVPHHGSKTSSTVEFVEALRPAIVLVSSGFGNRFGHPHEEVLERYQRIGAQVFSTAEMGTIEWRSQDSGAEMKFARRERLRRWQLGAALVVQKHGH